jgi:hypothetical protein
LQTRHKQHWQHKKNASITNNNITRVTSSIANTKTTPLPPPKTTSQKKQKRDGAEVRIGLGKWVKVWGSKAVKKGWSSELDILPFNDNKVMNVTRSKLSVLGLEDEENVKRHLMHQRNCSKL